MSGFTLHPLLPSSKVRVTAIYQHGMRWLPTLVSADDPAEDKLFVGCGSGALKLYTLEPSAGGDDVGDSTPEIRLIKSYPLFKKPIDQIGVLAQTNTLVILCGEFPTIHPRSSSFNIPWTDSLVTLFPLADLAKPAPTVLPQARNAHAFAITSYVSSTPSRKKSRNDLKTGKSNADETPSPTKEIRDLMIVGCRKKVVVYGAGKGGIKEGWVRSFAYGNQGFQLISYRRQELSLPHSPRQIIYPSSSSSLLPETVHLLYSPQSSVLLQIHPSSTQRLAVLDLPNAALPPPPAQSTSSSSIAMNVGNAVANPADTPGGLSMGGMSLTGLGGYVGLGTKTTVPTLGTRTVGGEVLIAREDLGVFYSTEGNYTRPESLQWPGPPDALAFSNPYIYSVVTTAASSSTAVGSSATVPISAVQIHLAPTLTLRQTIPIPSPSAGTWTVRGFTNTSSLSSLANTRMLFVSTPTDKTLALNEGSSIWALRVSEVGDQIDELVKEGRVTDAIGLVEAVGEEGLPKSRRLPHLRILQALAQFAHGQYQSAIETFLVFNVNPALVISLYPAETISASLHVPKDRWMELFGAVEGARLEPEVANVQAEEEGGAKSLLRGMAHLGGLRRRGSMDTVKTAGSGVREEESEGEKLGPIMSGEETMAPRLALESLIHFLSDRRQKLTGAISTMSSPLPAESTLPPLSSVPPAELHSLPSIPMTEYEPEQLLRMAQIIYTGLLKVYLVARPILVGSLCRIENWCEVAEVEELLKAQKKFGDLIDLYQGKKMHRKALNMLQELAKDEEDRLDRYPPTVRYLQKLGPSELDLILESSRWIFSEDPKMALTIFTADESGVEALPRMDVMTFLERTDKSSCRGYLEHVIDNLGEKGSEYHDKLAELYLEEARGKDGAEGYRKLLEFLDQSSHYRPYRLLNKLSGDELPEARAVLLGRMGKDKEALEIYVHRLRNYSAAEAWVSDSCPGTLSDPLSRRSYCSKVYAKAPDPHGIFLLLLRIYLHSSPILLPPALSLIAKHGVKLDASEVINLLPPLVTMEDVKSFFMRTLRDGHSKLNDHRVVKQLLSARKEEVERGLMGLQVRRVRITDQRIGEVTHLHCKDPFSNKLSKTRT
ncbi:Vam6/Vps39-like protein vacuolar protein sorting-associated protein 39, partial [Tremellales sp. Uapishka_1]